MPFFPILFSIAPPLGSVFILLFDWHEIVCVCAFVYALQRICMQIHMNIMVSGDLIWFQFDIHWNRSFSSLHSTVEYWNLIHMTHPHHAIRYYLHNSLIFCKKKRDFSALFQRWSEINSRRTWKSTSTYILFAFDSFVSEFRLRFWQMTLICKFFDAANSWKWANFDKPVIFFFL